VDDRTHCTPLAALLDDLASSPSLPGAHCRARHDLFDATLTGDGHRRPNRVEQQARDAARNVCKACPCFRACEDWLLTTPQSRRPIGIVAGIYVDIHGRLPADRQRHRTRGSGAVVDACR
jgi:WhiB family redox-sensing transcriptional regulator